MLSEGDPLGKIRQNKPNLLRPIRADAPGHAIPAPFLGALINMLGGATIDLDDMDIQAGRDLMDNNEVLFVQLEDRVHFKVIVRRRK